MVTSLITNMTFGGTSMSYSYATFEDKICFVSHMSCYNQESIFPATKYHLNVQVSK
jgi:hypothetical protein